MHIQLVRGRQRLQGLRVYQYVSIGSCPDVVKRQRGKPVFEVRTIEVDHPGHLHAIVADIVKEICREYLNLVQEQIGVSLRGTELARVVQLVQVAGRAHHKRYHQYKYVSYV